MSKYKWKNIKDVGLGIIAFEGTEHLASIISELRDCLDYVSIGLQRVSYHNDPIDPIDLNEIFRLKDEDGLVDNIVEVSLDTNKPAREQETDKRNILIQDAEDHGCSHVIIIDSDEFYTKNSFLRALKEIDDNNYEITYCQYVNYYGEDFQHFLVYPFKDGMYVPFVTKTTYRHSFECQDFPLPSDPTRRYVRPYDSTEDIKLSNGKIYKKKHYTVEYHIFPWEVVKMHHLSWIRADIRKKVNDWSSKKCFDNYNDLIDKAVDVYEHFDYETDEQQKASLLFNTPNHEVFVKKFPKQYIHPKYDFKTRLRPVKKYKRILILNLSSTNSNCDLFNKLDDCCKRTWAADVINHKYENIDYWTAVDTDKESYIDSKNHVAYIKTDPNKENVQQLLYRFLDAYKLIAKDNSYDYVLRTNTSTWCNIEILNSFLADETNDSLIYTFKFMSAFWSTFNIYCSGAAIIIPTRNIDIIDKLVARTNKETLELAYDDVMLSALWRQRAGNIKLTDPNKCFHSLEGEYIAKYYNQTEFDNIDLTIPMYQIKTFYEEDGKFNNAIEHSIRLENDIKKMEKLTELWNSKKDSYNIDEIASDLRNNKLDKTVSIIPYLKSEWLDETIEKNITQMDDIRPYNQETLDWLENRAKESGYKH